MAERPIRIITKRTAVPGKIPTGTTGTELNYIKTGELASNLADRKLYSYDGSNVFEFGSNSFFGLTGGTITGDTKIIGNLSANTIYSGSTNLYDIFLTSASLSGTSVSAGSNINVQNTGSDYKVSTVDSPYFKNLNVSGSTTLSSTTATTIYTNYIDFNTGTTTTSQPGRLSWNDADETGTLELDLKGGNVRLQVGEESLVRVYNEDSVILTAGTIVYVFSSQGNTVSVKRASASGETASSKTLGVVRETIAVNGRGFVSTGGLIHGLNTSLYSGGTALWLDTAPGGFTSAKPNAPYNNVLIGFVSRVHATVGSIFVHISNGWELDELHDVMAHNATYGDLLTYSAYSGYNVWVTTKTLNGSYTITGNTIIGGGLTTNTISASTYYNLPQSKPYINNKSEVVTGTTVGDNFNTGITIKATPISSSYVAVTANGLNVEVGNGVTTKDCYFSSNGSSSGVRNFSAITANDYLMWNTNIAGYYLDSTDTISIYYNILQ